MYKLTLLSIVLGIALGTHLIKSKNQTNSEKPIALVKYKDVIYHCETVYQQNCGMAFYCGKMKVYCAKDIQVEYLK